MAAANGAKETAPKKTASVAPKSKTASAGTTAKKTTARPKTDGQTKKKTSSRKRKCDHLMRYKMNIHLDFREPILGTKPSDPEVYKRYIAGKAPDTDTARHDIEMYENAGHKVIGDDYDKRLTVYLRDKNGRPCLQGYQVRGFFKEAARAMACVPGSVSSEQRAYIKEVDRLLFIKESEIPIKGDEKIEILERPLRGKTPQGERISLVASEMIENGSVDFTVLLWKQEDASLIREWLDWGFDNGLGQWHNSGKGSFRWTETDDSGTILCSNKNIDPWADAVCCQVDERHIMNK